MGLPVHKTKVQLHSFIELSILAARFKHLRRMIREEHSDRNVAILRLMELHWQKEVIERWLDSPIPLDSITMLEELLSSVDRELAKLEAELKGEDIHRNWTQAS